MTNSRTLALVLALCGSIPLAACGDDGVGAGGAGGSGSGGTPASGGGGEASGGGGDNEGGQATTGPIDAPADEWTFVSFPEAICMNGTPTGIGVNPHATSDDVVIFLMGGNACFNTASCFVTANLDGYGPAEFAEEVEFLNSSPYFDRDNAENPFREFSYVFVPYCTGDVHAGNNADVDVGNQTRQFFGYTNMGLYLDRVVPTFPDAQRVVLTGVSAGGFGAAYNYDQVASAFAGTPVTLIDDSGPPMAEAYVAPCLQQRFMDLWGIEQTLPTDCADCGAGGVFLEPYIEYVLAKYPERSLGLVSSEADETIRSFWSFGANDCANINGAPGTYDPALYEEGLIDLRDRIADSGRFRLFMVPGQEHVFVDNGLNAVSVNGVALEDWMVQAIEEDPAWANVNEP